MPSLVTAAVSAFGTWIGGAAGATLIMGAEAIAAGIITGGTILGGLALSASQQRKAKQQAKDAYNAAQVDRLANVVTTIAPRDLVLGRVRKGGTVVFRGSAGADKTIFLVHLAIAGHEIDGVEQIYFNDQPVTVDANGYVTSAPYAQTRRVSLVGQSMPADYVAGSLFSYTEPATGITTYTWQQDITTYYARVWWDLGAPGSTADARTQALFPGLWNSNHRGEGVAKLFVEFTYNENAFPSGPPNVTALIRGAKVYDPRSGSTNWSDNPALLMRHVYQHSHFGKATVSAAEDARFIVAANACDTPHSYNVGGAIDIEPLYAAGLVAPYGTPARSLLDDLSQAMAGMWAFAGGELYVHAGVYTAPVKTLTDDDLAVVQREGESESQEQVSIAVHRERAQKFNTVNARIWDAAQDYKQVALTPLKGTALITRDGQELAQEVTFPAIGFAPQALHVAGVMMRDARDPLTVEAPFKMTAWPLEIFDTVSLTLARYGWAAKTFRILGRRWDRAKGVVFLTLKETAAAIYTPDAAFSAQGFAANTALPSPWDIDPPTLSTIYSGTDELVQHGDGTITTRVRVTWPALVDSSITQAGFIDVEWSPAAQTLAWQRVTVAGSETQAILAGPADGQTIIVRARARNSVAVSDWGLQVAHTVIGKTEPPSDVERFTIDGDVLRWPEVGDIDLAGYRIRFNYGINTFWGGGAALHEGLLTSSPYTLSTRPSGVVTLLIKAVDTSGNESTNAASITVNLGDTDISNVLLEYEEAPDFTGTITNGAVSAGVLQSDATDLFYGDDLQPFYGRDTDPFYSLSTYAQMRYEWSVTPMAEGRVVVRHGIAASDYTIEFKRDDQGAFYGGSADLFYGASATEAFYGPVGSWEVWPGEIHIDAPEALSFRITTAGGPTRGVITTASVVLDVPDVDETLDDIVISAAGTRLPITESYRAIDNVQITVQTDGNGGTSARIVDKDTTGPLIVVLNASGTAVNGLVDASIKGF